MKAQQSDPTDHSAARALRWKRGLRTAIVYTLIFVVVSFGANLWLTRDQTSGPAPEIYGQDLQGKWVTHLLQNSDRPVLLYFFAEWCPVCKFQHDAISRIAEDHQVLAIAMQSGDTDNVRQYAQQAGLEMPVINDIRGTTSRSYGVNGVPASFVVDRQGQIRFSTRGYATAAGLRLRLWLVERDLL